MTGHRALEKKQITQGNNRKVQNPSGSPNERRTSMKSFSRFFHELLAIYDSMQKAYFSEKIKATGVTSDAVCKHNGGLSCIGNTLKCSLLF